MTFFERLYNTAVSTYDWIMQRLKYIPGEEELARKHFAHLAPLPSLNDLIRNVSVNFVNTHRALSPPRPVMPGMNSE